MSQSLGKGFLGSLRAQVDLEIRELARKNSTLRGERYSMPRRLLRALVVDRSVGQFLGAYSIVLLATILCEWISNSFAPDLLPGYHGSAPRDFLKDIGSYLIAAQVGLLAIVSVAVAVVTLLSEREDGSSVNTDIRLYYVESYSYELAVSGIALLIVLTLQLFWPLQHILHAAGLGGRDYSFKLFLAALHASWFALNLMLFLQFITTTLRFVEPNSREKLRERYSANEVIPRDAKKRLLRVMYLHAPAQFFGDESLKDGPSIMFGHDVGLGDSPEPEITTVFSQRTKLVDVRLKPLHWVLNRWLKRVKSHPTRNQRSGRPSWDGNLTISANFDDALDGRQDWVIRRGGVPLTFFEKWVIRRCFRFRRAKPHEVDIPTTENFLAQLVNKMVKQIEDSATAGFKAALDEATQYHRFILATQNTKDDKGNPINLAEIGGFFSRPDEAWVSQYRRIFFAAAGKISSDTYFIDRLSNLTAYLLPVDALNFSTRVLQSLLMLGVFEAVAMEGWLTSRASTNSSINTSGGSVGMAGSDKRAFENALIGFVGGWEGLLQTLDSAFDIERRPGVATNSQRWTAFSKGFPVFQTHLHNAAYFFACAVWNDDELGADRFRDLLLRWLNAFHDNLERTYIFSNTLLLTPDLNTRDWQHVETAVARHIRFRQDLALPPQVAGVLLKEMHCDVVCVCGLVALHWYATGQQPSEMTARAAVLTLRREKRESDGADLTRETPKTVFRLLFDFAIRYALNPRFAETSYSGTIDGLVQFLTGLSSPRMVSGRVYGGFGIDGFDTLRTVLLAALAANLPPQGDDGVSALIEDMKNDARFNDDGAVRTFAWTIQQMVQTLDQVHDDEVYKKAAAKFSKELDLAATARLQTILSTIVVTFEDLRKERLKSAPLDESRMNLVRQSMSESVLANGPNLAYPLNAHTY